MPSIGQRDNSGAHHHSQSISVRSESALPMGTDGMLWLYTTGRQAINGGYGDFNRITIFCGGQIFSPEHGICRGMFLIGRMTALIEIFRNGYRENK